MLNYYNDLGLDLKYIVDLNTYLGYLAFDILLKGRIHAYILIFVRYFQM